MTFKPHPRVKNSLHFSASQSTFTRHGKDRKLERFKIPCEELLLQLDAGMCVHIGAEDRPWIIHRLFFSRDDAGWGVAVQDRHSKEILTLLPLSYYGDLHRKVTPWERREAKRLVHWSPPACLADPPLPEMTEFPVPLPLAA